MSSVLRVLFSLGLVLFLTAGSAWAQGTVVTVQPSEKCRALLLRNPDRQGLRAAFISEYAEKIYASKAQNEHFFQEALIAKAGEPEFMVFIVENAWMKTLNDVVIKDKDLVTALTNLHKEIFLKYLWSHPRLRETITAGYSDFKSLRIKISSNNPQTVADMTEVFNRSREEFFNLPLLREVIRAEDVDERWFTLGHGRTMGSLEDEVPHDLAALAVKGARDQESLVQDFSDPDFQKLKDAERIAAQALHRSILIKFGQSELIESAELSLEIYAHARKAISAHGKDKVKGAEKLLSYLHTEYPEESVGYEDALKIYELARLVDGFTPSMLIAERETLTLHEAHFGAVSIDFIGLGAENLKATARAIVNSENLIDAVILARIEEREVTRDFKERQESIRRHVENFFNSLRQGQARQMVDTQFKPKATVRFSGDDGIIVLAEEFTVRDQLSFLRTLSAELPGPKYRLTYIGPDAAQSNASSESISHAESIEKILRIQINLQLGSAIARQIHFLISNPDIFDDRSVYLIIRTNLNLSREQRNKLVAIFEQSVQIFEEQLKNMGQAIRYRATDAFLTSPSTHQPPTDYTPRSIGRPGR